MRITSAAIKMHLIRTKFHPERSTRPNDKHQWLIDLVEISILEDIKNT